ncbi:MAG: DUF4340 domain-containing protein [Gammaproteobacteria bacterium]|nr:DUF4340 domain-containing protein [Gammaproteobacteria bacterium]
MASQRTRLLLNLGLLVAVGVLAAVALLRPGAEEAPARLTGQDAAAIVRIVVQGEDQVPVELERRGAHWWMTRPWELEASPRRIEDLLGFARAPVHASYPADDLVLDRYGLAPPRMRLELDDTVIAFGDTNPVSRSRYVRVGDRVHLIDDTRTYLLNATPESYLGPRLLPRDARIEALALPGLRITRAPGGAGWQTDADVPADLLQARINAWQGAEALWAKAYTPREGLPTVTVTLADGRTIAFTVAATEPDLELARPDLGIVYTLPGEAATGLLDGPAPVD